jgi:hypothetical protein
MTRRTLEIVAFCIALLIAALAFHAWLDSHDDQLRLQSTIASQKQILDAADARERDRNSALNATLAQIESLKRQAQTQTPEQLLASSRNIFSFRNQSRSRHPRPRLAITERRPPLRALQLPPAKISREVAPLRSGEVSRRSNLFSTR